MSNLPLAELQQRLQQYLLDGKNRLDEFTSETPTFSRDERLHIYHEAYRLRLIDALRNDFPALEMYVGDDKFSELMSEFVNHHPSQHPSLRWLGKNLPTFLRNQFEAQDRADVYELAEFEWAQAMAFDAENSPTVSMTEARELQNSQWLDLRIEFHPSLNIVKGYTDAAKVWQSLVKDQVKIDLQKRDDLSYWLVWRDDLQVVYREADAIEARCLEAFQSQKNFSDICEGLCQWFVAEEVPLRAAQYLQKWIGNGLITRLITSE